MSDRIGTLLFPACVILLVAAFSACSTLPDQQRPFLGSWRAVLDIPDGGLPFHIDITEKDGALRAAARNGVEELPFTVDVEGETIRLIFDHYDCWIEGSLDEAQGTITGDWRRRRGAEERSLMRFSAQAGIEDRFDPIEEARATPSPITDVTGKWNAVIGRGDDAWRSLAVLEQDGKRVTGTMLTKVGDFRYFEGTFEEGTLRMSVFDGCHAFLVRAETVAADIMEGTFRFGKSGSPLTLTAGGEEMPDPWTLTKIANRSGTFSFGFPDVSGTTVSSSDARFAGKPLVVCVIGTWCCNCHDAGELLAALYEDYRDDGLEMAILCSEATGDFAIDSEMMRRFARKWEIDCPVLYVGGSSKKKTAAALPDLDCFLSYPTTIFIDRAGKVRKIHTGFTGPGTGAYYERMCDRYRAVIEEMLAE